MSNPIIFRLHDSEGKKVLDSVSGEYEDSFSLETFDDLLKLHFQTDPANTKGFIIARVQTYDPKQPEKTFYSYYDAFHLNKILFQTQVVLKKKYIHRLHVLNPLSNTDIIGNVEYYLVKPQTPSTQVEENPKPISSLQEIDMVASPSVKAIDRGDQITWSHGAHRIANLEGTTEQDKITSFPAPYLELMDKVEVPVDTLFPNRSKSVSHGKGQAKGMTITANFPDDPPSVNDQKKVQLTPGVVTQFSIPLSDENMNTLIPRTATGNRRALSYRNALSASTVPVSFKEWTKLIEEEEKIGANDPEFYDDLNMSLFSPALKAAKQKELEPIIMYYDAFLFATDDDYLGSSKIRKLFLDNAVNPEEAKLFEMKEFTGEPEAIPFDAPAPHRHRRRHEVPMCILQ